MDLPTRRPGTTTIITGYLTPVQSAQARLTGSQSVRLKSQRSIFRMPKISLLTAVALSCKLLFPNILPAHRLR
jgi:hypothetical protein